jgi:hypothetical protein
MQIKKQRIYCWSVSRRLWLSTRSSDATIFPGMSDEEARPSTEAPKDQENKGKKLVSAEEFIVRWPLYTPAPVDGFYLPASVSNHCDTPVTCAKETTWLRMNDSQYVNLEGSGGTFRWVWYLCGLCKKGYLVVMYRETAHEQRAAKHQPISSARAVPSRATITVTTQVQKIGQYPPLSISIPKALAKALGQHHSLLYKKALISRNDGYGLGAVSYVRRVVEDKTEELIEVVAQLAVSHGIDANIVEKIRAAKDEKGTYDNKLKIASAVFPQSLTINGVNPLDVLFKLVSAGLHDLTEEQCIRIADETKSVFEYTFTRLRAEITDRKEFAETVTKWAGGDHPAAKKPTD